MRWDDTQGLSPLSLERRARGLYGVLERTKTSGPGKHCTVLPVWVSQDAWLQLFGQNLTSALNIDPAALLVSTVCTH